MKLYMLTDFPGESADATALVWADDPGEARWMINEATGKRGRVATELSMPDSAAIAAMIGLRTKAGR